MSIDREDVAVADTAGRGGDSLSLEGVDLRGALEAILMVALVPVSPMDLAAATQMPVEQVEEALRGLAADYDGRDGSRERGFELREIEGEWRLYSRSKWASWVSQFVAGAESTSLTRAAMETLAIIAYRQPVTRGQIARIRGVNVDSVLRTLAARDLIAEDGTSPSGAHLFRTTSSFLEYMGMSSLDDLVPLGPFMPGPENIDYLLAELP
ncbi:SMC-Scp complex subunit ScpB [Schaalia sp. JY-X169]|uniref:SMC-Scp complex subunit ScpB n=1 Tax=Schaalia sp. JY-X169 TaxID=2758572 RepID=UPI002174EDF2|nr:SMC-Scp complex subunit ScpB [Schaalia sp. JY-X169]